MEAVFCLKQVVNFLISVAPIIGRLSKGDDIYQIAKYGRYGLLAPDADDLYDLSRYGNYVDDVGDAAKKASGATKAQKVENFQNRIDNIRNKMPNSKLKNQGNMAVADVQIKDLPDEFMGIAKFMDPIVKG